MKKILITLTILTFVATNSSYAMQAQRLDVAKRNALKRAQKILRVRPNENVPARLVRLYVIECSGDPLKLDIRARENQARLVTKKFVDSIKIVFSRDDRLHFAIQFKGKASIFTQDEMRNNIAVREFLQALALQLGNNVTRAALTLAMDTTQEVVQGAGQKVIDFLTRTAN